MALTHRDTIVAVFEDRSKAQEAVAELHRVGFQEDQIGVAVREPETAAAGEEGSKAGEGTATGAVAGAGVGALWSVGIMAGVLPGIGPAVAGGALASLLASAAGGAVAGGLIGALVGMGIPEEEAAYYEEEFKAGRTIVTVETDGRAPEAAEICERYGAYDASAARPV